MNEVFVLVEMFQDIIQDVLVFTQMKTAFKEFEGYTGYSYEDLYKNGQANNDWQYDDHCGTQIYKVPVNEIAYNVRVPLWCDLWPC